MQVSPQHILFFFFETSLKTYSWLTSLYSASYLLWGLLQFPLACPPRLFPASCFSWNTSAGVIPSSIKPGQDRAVLRQALLLPALLMPVSDLHCGLRLFFFFFFCSFAIYILAVLSLCCLFRLSPSSGSGATLQVVSGLLIAVVSLLLNVGSRHSGSMVVAHGFSCWMACGIFPDQGRTPVPHIGAGSS